MVVNGQFVLTGSFGAVPNYPNYRGINTMILNPTKCTASDWRQFDTWVNTDGANALLDYLNYLDNGIIILMVSFDESIQNIAPAAKLLKLATRVDIAGMTPGSKYAAVIQKGYPHKTAIVTAPPNCFSPELVVRIVGKSYVITVFNVAIYIRHLKCRAILNCCPHPLSTSRYICSLIA